MTKPLPRIEKWSYWRDKCDTLFSRLVKDKYGWLCVETGANKNLQTAHIIPRDYMNTRWDFDNAVCITSGRHKYYTHHPLEWKRFVDKLFGKGYYEKMENRALIIKRWSTDDLKELYEKLSSKTFIINRQK